METLSDLSARLHSTKRKGSTEEKEVETPEHDNSCFNSNENVNPVINTLSAIVDKKDNNIKAQYGTMQ